VPSEGEISAMSHFNWWLAPQKLPSQTANLLLLQRKIILKRTKKLVDITEAEDRLILFFLNTQLLYQIPFL